MRIALSIILALVACEHPAKQAPLPAPSELGGIRGLVTGGGYAPNAMVAMPHTKWLEKGPLAASIAIDETIVTTDGDGRYELLLPAGTYGVRIIDLAPARCHREPDGIDSEVIVDVAAGAFTDVMWRCHFIYL